VIAGSTGFLGRWLVDALLADGASVLGLARRRPVGPARAGYRCVPCDLTSDAVNLRRELAAFEPSVVFHLATSADAPSADDRSQILSALHTTENLLDACSALPRPPRVVVVSSSAVYGDSEGTALTERSPTAAATMYGVSKILTEALATRWYVGTQMPVIRVRPFNIIGPGQPATRAVSSFAKQIVQLEAGHATGEIQTQGLGASRDFVDVRDVASALRTIAERGRAGSVYNVCSGRAIRVESVLKRMLAASRLREVPVVSAAGHGVTYQRGDCRRLAALGWRPRVSLRQSLDDILNDWRTMMAQRVT
jgi:GDP-4-dehydro-6-deoxy-D-mannose reductase